MAQYEYKVVKSLVVDQEYYTSFLASFGWQVQNIQEFVDQVVNQSLGFSNSTSSGSMYGRTFYPHKSDHSFFSGYQTNHGWGSQSNTTITKVKTKLTITFFRDIATPNRNELNAIESKWWKASDRFLSRVRRTGNPGDDSWPEWVEIKRWSAEARAIRGRKPAAAPAPPAAKVEPKKEAPRQVENKPAQVPNLPATAKFNSLEVTHNVFQSGQAGIQIRMSFSVQNRKALKCGIYAYFCDENNVGLADLNQKFCTPNGKVCLGASFTPNFEDALFNDYILFMPYAELDQPDGTRTLNFEVRIYDTSTNVFIASSERSHFSFTKSGSNMRGEATRIEKKLNIEKPAPVKTSKPVASKKTTASMPTPPPVKEVAPITRAEREQKFMQGAGWKEKTEDRLLYMEGIFLLTEGKQAAANKNFKKALDLNPGEERYWSSVSMGLANQGKLDESIALIEKGLQALPQSIMLQADLGHRYISKMDFASAEGIAEKLEKMTNPDAVYNSLMIKAISTELQKKYKKAIELYDRADALANENNVLIGLGQQRCREGMKLK